MYRLIINYIILLSSFFCLNIAELKAQTCTSCASVVTIDVDLSAKPDSVWISTDIDRTGQCCQGTGSDRCIRFNVKTHPLATQLGFTLAAPPIPPAMEYALNCGTPQSVDIPLCINGPGPHCIVYCKPGNDILKYKITSSKIADISPDIAVGQGCKDTIWARGFTPSTIKWNVIYPSSAYNSYLSCTSGCDTVIVGPTSAIFPPYIDVEVSGSLMSPCDANTAKDTVRVYFVSDKSVSIFPPDPTICYGGTPVSITAMPVGGAAPYSYKWSNGATTKTISVGSPGVYSVEVSDTTDCPPVNNSVTVVQHMSPITADAGDGNICIDNPSVQLNGSVQIASGGIWSGGAGVYVPNNTTLNAIYTLSPIELSLKSATLKLTTTGNAGCPPESDNVTITVSPKPSVSAGTDGIVCMSALNIPLNGSVTGSSTDGVWSTLGTGTFSDKYDLHALYYPTSADTTVGFVKLVLSSIAVGICQPVTDTVTVFFGNEPIADFSFTQPACSGQNIQFGDHTIVGWGSLVSWVWDFGDGTNATIKNPIKAYSLPGTYNVKLDVVSNNGCKGSITQPVVVSQNPVADFTFSHTCFGASTTFTDASLYDVSWFWTFGNGNNSIDKNPVPFQYQNSGNYIVTLTVKNASGCPNSISKTVTVFDNPTADFKVGNICTGVAATFNDNSVSITNPIISWKWNFGNGNTSTIQNPQQTFPLVTTLPVSLIVSTVNCSDTIIKNISAEKTPSILPNTSSGCSPYGVTFQSPVESNVNYSWDFGDGSSSIDTKPSHTFLNVGTTTVVYTVKNIAKSIYGCVDSLVSTVTSFPKSTAAFTMSNDKICSNSSVSFTNNSQNAVSYVWNFNDGTPVSNLASPNHTFINNTTSTQFLAVTLVSISADGCKDTAIRYLTVYPLPTATMIIDKTTICSPSTVHFITTAGAKTYFWDYGDGTSEFGDEDMLHLFDNTTASDIVYTVKLTVTSLQNCVTISQANITAHPNSTAKFTLAKTSDCSPFTASITNITPNGVSYAWDFGDGTTGNSALPTFTHVYTNATATQITRTISLTVTGINGCISSYNTTANVFPVVKALYTPDKTTACAPFNVTFTNQSTNALAYLWDFGDGSTLSFVSPTHNYKNTGTAPKTFTVKMIAISSYGCSDTAAPQIITANNVPLASFKADKATGCSSENITFTNQSTNASVYAWDFGDGTTSNSALTTVSHVFVNTSLVAKTYIVSLISATAQGCSDTALTSITINPLPSVTFTVDKSSFCAPSTVHFTTASGAKIYFWDYGDGKTEFSTEDVFHSFDNATANDIIYTVKLTVTSLSGCTNTSQSTVTAHPNSKALFTLTKSSGCAPFTANINSQSTNAQSFVWNFGDGTTGNSNAATINHIYQNKTTLQLTHTISVTVTSKEGCSSTYALPVNVFPEVVAQFNPNKLIGCSPFDVSFTNQSTNAQIYVWDFGDNNSSNDVNPVHTYINSSISPQIFKVSLIAKSSFGCADTMGPISITADYSPVSLFKPDKTIGCSPVDVNFSNQSKNAASYLWDFGDGKTSNSALPNVLHSYSNASNVQVSYTVSLTVTSAQGCTNNYSQIINVFPMLEAKFTHNGALACSPLNVTFTNQSVNANAYKWDFGDGYSSTDVNPFHTYLNSTMTPKTYNVTLISYLSSFGCADTLGPIPITVASRPDALFKTDKSTACSPASITITNQSQNATSYQWSFGDGNSSNNSQLSFSHDYTNTATVTKTNTISLTVTNADGCTHQFAQSVAIFPGIDANFSVNKASGCSPLDVTFTNKTKNASSYKWDFGDGTNSSNLNVTHTYINNSNSVSSLNVFLIANSSYGCSDTSLLQNITVSPRINAAFDVDIASGCSPLSVNFTNTTTNATSYLWNFDDGSSTSIVENEKHTFTNTSSVNKTHNVVLTANNTYNCPDTSIQSITVYPDITVAISPDTIGCSPLVVHFNAISKTAVNYSWDFNDGQVSNIKNPLNTFTNTTFNDVNRTVVVQASSSMGCIATDNASITIYATPNSDFSLNTAYLEIPNKTVQITNNTKGTWQTMWYFGDGKTSTSIDPISHEYADTGIYKIILQTQSAHCIDTSSQTLIVHYGLVKADYDSSFFGCAPLTVTFINKSINATKFKWDFGDGKQSEDSVPSHTYEKPGTYVVELTAMNGSIKDVSRKHTITVYDVPVVDFEVVPSITYLPDADVRYYNKSKNAQLWLWTFGDGDTSSKTEPNHTYKDVGVYDVSLTGWNVHGCIDTMNMPNAVTVLKDCMLQFPNAFTPVENETGGKYLPELPEKTNDIFHPIFKNIETYHLEIFNRWGELIFASNQLNVGWDGFYRKTLSKQDVYVWKVEATCYGGKKFKRIGNVTLLK